MTRRAWVLLAGLGVAAMAFAANEVQHMGPHDYRAATRFFAPRYLGATSLTNNAATMVLPSTGDVVTVNQMAEDGGVPEVTSIAAGTAGRCVTLIFAGETDIRSGTALVIGVDGGMQTTASDTLRLCSDGTNWREVARSVN